MVERLLTGRNYRLLVVDNKLIAASERTPCTVIGDGVRTIKELIDVEIWGGFPEDAPEPPED